MEKGSTIASNKEKPDDSIAGEKDGVAGDGLDSKKEPNAEKELVEKEEVTPKNDVNSKKDRTSTVSTTPKTSLRSTRSSNNPEFVAKQRHFLQKVNQGVFYQSEEEGDSMVTNGSPTVLSKRKRSVSGGLQNTEPSSSGKNASNTDSGLTFCSSPTPSNTGGSKPVILPKKRKSEIGGLTRDIFCWVCHKEIGPNSGGAMLSCEVCPRVYHARCCHSIDSSSARASSPVSPVASSSSRKSWACPECVKMMRAETMGTRSRAMQLISMDQLCTLLKHVLIRVRSVTGAEPFFGPVDLQLFPGYRDFVANPMDLGLIDRNIRRRTYGSTEAFFADMKWILHNSIIFNTQHSKLSSIARSMIKVCRQELSEIENCPDCYANAHTRKDNWFIEVCRRPHILLWAKLKGFPHWPAKAMRVNKEGCVDVRFFGAHDRAWVPAKDCFLYSEEMPAPPKNRKKNNLDGCIMEVEDHIKKLKEKFEVFVYAPFRNVFDPAQEDIIIMKMLPKYQPLALESPIVKPSRSPERLMSRGSPAISAGTEEESEEDQSLDGDEPVTSKRILDSPFEDSMEVPSGDASILDTSTVSKAEADLKKNVDEKEMEVKKLEEKDEEGKVEEETAEEEKVKGDSGEEEKVEEEQAKKGKDEAEKVEKEEEIDSEDETKDAEKVNEAKEEEVQTKDVESRSLKEEVNEPMEEDSQESVASKEEEMVEVTEEKEDIVEDEKKESEIPEKSSEEESQESVFDETSKLEEEDQEMSCEIKDGDKEEIEDKDQKDESKKPSSEEDSMSSSDTGKLGKESEESQEASVQDSVKSMQQMEENSTLGVSKDSCEKIWANMPVDDDFRLSLAGNVSREIISDSLDNFNCEASFFARSHTKEDEPAAKIIEEAKLDDAAEKTDTIEEEEKEKDSEEEKKDSEEEKKDSEEEKVEEKGDDSKVADEKKTEEANDSEEMEVETKGKDSDELVKKDGANKAVEDDKNASISSETPEKIDVNRLRVSLMTKCSASPPSGPRDSSGLALPEKEVVLANALHPETGALIAADDATDKAPVEEELPKEVTSAIAKESPKALVAAPINNKGDVGSQLSILGKLQQRLSFAKEDSDNEEVQEKDENTVDETESVAGDASSSCSEHEDEEEGAKKASKSGDKSEEKSSKENQEAVTKSTKDSDEASASTETEIVDKVVDEVPKESEEAVLKTVETQDTTEEEKEEKEDEAEKVISEKESEKEKETTEEKVRETSSDDAANKDASKEVAVEEEQSAPENLCKRVENSDDTDKSESMQDIGMDLTSSKEGSSTKETEGSECGRKASKAKTQPSDSRSSEEDGPSNPKRRRLSDDKNKVGTIHVKSKAALMGTKVEDAVEEEVLSREVLKESNMVVVQKMVKSKRFEEETVATAPAPKRARKGVAHKALIVDRSDSPGQDEVFPSMFLDPSVTITVLQESEKENGESKESPTNPPSSVVEELRTSVNLSNDVSLTMVRPSAPLEGLAAAQDVAYSRSTEQNPVDILGVPTTCPVPGASPPFRPRARKSFPRPSQRISSRSPQPLAHGSSNADLKRLAQAVNGRDMSMAAMNSASPHGRTLSSTLPSSSVSMRVSSSQPPLPITSLAFSSSPTLSTASTSQPLVHSMVSQVMPSSTVMVTPTQGAGPSTSSVRMPHLHPRPPSFPLSGPQPIFAPSEAGPISAEFGKHAHKLANYMRGAIEEILGDLSRMGNSEAALKLLRLEIEKLKWEHQQEVAELKHNHDLMIIEMRNSLEKEKMRCVNEVRRHCEAEKMRAIEETKRKQWCANCSKEALFYCCWNTSYCDYPCQQAHWPRHMASCAQNNAAMNDTGEGDAASNRKDGSTSGHKGLPAASAAPPPFHQLHRPGGSTQQESLPEEEYYDEDSNSPSAPRMGTSGGTYRVKRRRCGLCKGCSVKNNCGNCAPCRNSKTHQVCRMRRCRSLQSDWTPGGGGTSRPITPEPSLSVSLKTPPLTYASKKRKTSSRSPRSSATPANLIGSTSYSMANPQQNGDNHSVEMIAATADASDTQIVPFCGSLASQSRQLPPLPHPPPPPQNQQKASTLDLSSQPIGHHMIHPHILSQAMTPYMYPNPYSHPTSTNSESPCSASHSLTSYSQPLSYPQPPLLTQSSPSAPPPMPPLLHPQHSEHLPYPPDLSQCPQGCSSKSSPQTLPSHMPAKNGHSPRFPNSSAPPPLHKNGMVNGDPPPHPPSPFLPNPFLFPQYSQNPMLQPPYGQSSNIRPPPPPPPTSSAPSTPKPRSRAQASKRTRSPYSRTRQPSPSPQPCTLNSPFSAFLSSTSIVMGQHNHNCFLPGSCEISSTSLAEQHQLHRQQMAAGVNMFSNSMRFAARPSYFV